MSQPIILDGGAKEIKISLPPEFTVQDGVITVKADFTNIVVMEGPLQRFKSGLGATPWKVTIEVAAAAQPTATTAPAALAAPAGTTAPAATVAPKDDDQG